MAGLLDTDDLLALRGDEPLAKKKEIKKIEYSCEHCGLSQNCQTPYMPAWGDGKKKILFVLDTPSQTEDAKGSAWSGKNGSYIRREIEKYTGLDFDRDCQTTYAVRCAAKKTINAIQCSACRSRLHEDIRAMNPAIIIPFGYWATLAVAGDLFTDRDKGRNSTDWAGEQIPDQRFNAWLCPTFETSFIGLDLKTPNYQVLVAMKGHIEKAMTLLSTPVPIRDDRQKVKIINDLENAIKILNRLYDREDEPVYSFDYETTGKKPYREGHQIITVAVSNGKKSWSMPFFDDDDFRTAWKKLLRARHIFWIAHNAKFEWIWTRQILGYWPRNLLNDTMLMAHIEDSHKRCGLKPLTYCKLGVPAYEESTAPYLSASKIEEENYGANAFNNIKRAPLHELLYYNALDALYTYELWQYFLKHLSKKELWCSNFFSEVSVSFAHAEYNGLSLHIEEAEATKDNITLLMDRLYRKIQKEARNFGWDKSSELRPSASDDLEYFIYDILDTPVEKRTIKGKRSTDKEVLEGIENPVIDKICQWKKLQKLRDTYLTGAVREATNGVLHPFFHLHGVATFRTSSSEPNFQNFPKRDKEVSRAIKGLLYPHPGHKLIEYDYKALEVAMNACYNKDPNLINYILDPSTDMHRDTGEELFFYKRGELPKYDRGIAKNKFVFPEFYGSWYKSTAQALWKYCSSETKEHLRQKGFASYEKYEEHVKKMEQIFWSERFGAYAQWRKDTWENFQETGNLESYLGFKYHIPMTRNEVTNAQAQGAGCHCLCWTFLQVDKVIQKRKLKSMLMGQIHDSAVASVEPEEEKLIDYLFWYYGTKKIAERFKWIIVPLQMEKAVTGIDRPWFEEEEVGLLNVDISITEYPEYLL